MLKTDFESQEKKPLYESPSIKEINIVTSQRIMTTSPSYSNGDGVENSYENW